MSQVTQLRGKYEALNLVAQRHQSLFVDHHLPFTDILDVTESLHKRLRGRIDSKSLEKANHLCNLATFIYIILDPDHAAGMLEHVSEGAGLDAIGRSGGSRKGKERERSVDQVQEHTRNRNRILIMAWKQFWSVVIPRSMRSSKPAMDLWLDFATQVRSSSPPVHAANAVDLPDIHFGHHRRQFHAGLTGAGGRSHRHSLCCVRHCPAWSMDPSTWFRPARCRVPRTGRGGAQMGKNGRSPANGGGCSEKHGRQGLSV